MEIAHTVKRFGGEAPSIAGIGGYVVIDPVIRVHWNDARETALVVVDDGHTVSARAYHAGTAYDLRPVGGDLETVADHWIAAITRRLQAKRLQERVRGGVPRDQVTARVQAWNKDLNERRAM